MDKQVQVHEFGSSAEAYSASQTRDEISDGDVLSVPFEGVVGVMVKARPTAVTATRGQFHALVDGLAWDTFEEGGYADSAEKAREVVAGWTPADDTTFGWDRKTVVLTTAQLHRISSLALDAVSNVRIATGDTEDDAAFVQLAPIDSPTSITTVVVFTDGSWRGAETEAARAFGDGSQFSVAVDGAKAFQRGDGETALRDPDPGLAYRAERRPFGAQQ